MHTASMNRLASSGPIGDHRSWTQNHSTTQNSKAKPRFNTCQKSQPFP